MKLNSVRTADGTLLNPSVGDRIRVRYSRTEDGRLKNTLLTLADKDGAIFFGIARCNLAEGDSFNRKRGRSVAGSRVRAALEAFMDIGGHKHSFLKGLRMGPSLLWGTCSKDKIKELITHFKNIDAYMDAQRKISYTARREARKKEAVA